MWESPHWKVTARIVAELTFLKLMNRLGADGWELCTTISPRAFLDIRGEEQRSAEIFVPKLPKPN